MDLGTTGGEGLSRPMSDLQPDAQGGRWLRRHLAGGVAAITTVVDNRFRAVTATAFTLVSIEPVQFLISIEAESQMENWLQHSQSFGLNILSRRQQLLADRFAGFAPLAPARFEGIAHFFAVTGSPILAESVGWADCTIVRDFETGDHRCFIGEAVSVGEGVGDPEEPLVYYLNRYRRFQ